MIRLERSVWACGVAASARELAHGAGVAIPDPVLTNAGKNIGDGGPLPGGQAPPRDRRRLGRDGPYVEDVNHPELRPFVEKYYRGAAPDDAMLRLRVMKLIRDLVASEYGGYWYTEIIHGSGSPAAEMIQMYRETDLGGCKQLALDALQGRAAVGERPTVREEVSERA